MSQIDHERELQRTWRALNDKAREDILGTLKSGEPIAVDQWVTDTAHGNKIGCLMMDGHVGTLGSSSNDDVAHSLADLYELENVEETATEYGDVEYTYVVEYAHDKVLNMASAFDRWAMQPLPEGMRRYERVEYEVERHDPSGTWEETLEYKELTTAGRTELIAILEGVEL